MRRFLAALAATLTCGSGFGASSEAGKQEQGCTTKRCELRVTKRLVREHWRAAVQRYGVGLLRVRMACESGGHGGYRLATTGNGYWFAHQFNVGAWTGAGGRYSRELGRPVGVWSVQPGRLEQDYRAARWAGIHGGDPWPNCP